MKKVSKITTFVMVLLCLSNFVYGGSQKSLSEIQNEKIESQNVIFNLFSEVKEYLEYEITVTSDLKVKNRIINLINSNITDLKILFGNNIKMIEVYNVENTELFFVIENKNIVDSFYEEYYNFLVSKIDRSAYGNIPEHEIPIETSGSGVGPIGTFVIGTVVGAVIDNVVNDVYEYVVDYISENSGNYGGGNNYNQEYPVVDENGNQVFYN